MSKYLLGFDLGGTKLSWALVTKNGKLVQFQSIPVFLSKNHDAKRSKKTIVETISEVISDIGAKNIQGVGLASAGPMDLEKGTLVDPSNFKNWGTFPFIAKVKQSLGKKKIRLPLYFQNDAMAAALGEGWLGGAKKLDNYIVITLGTGIGTGVIFNGEPALSRGMGGEWGINIVDWLGVDFQGDHYAQTVEGVASGTAIVERAFKLGFSGSSIEDLMLDILRGNNSYRKLFSDASKALAILAFNLSIGFHPQKILFTGGLIGASEYFWDELETNYEKLIGPRHSAFRVVLGIGKLGVRAGAIGAARLALLNGSLRH